MSDQLTWDLVLGNFLGVAKYPNTVNTYPMVIKNPNGLAPASLDRLYKVMAPNEMSPHGIENCSGQLFELFLNY